MNNEFIFGPFADAVKLARKNNWRHFGRAAWLTPELTCVYFLALEEQLAAVSKGERV